MLYFRAIHRHYDSVGRPAHLEDWTPERAPHNTVIVPISGVHRAVVQALQYARSLSPDVRAVYVDVDPRGDGERPADWERLGPGRAAGGPASRPTGR